MSWLPFISKRIAEAWRKGYETGLTNGYEMGYMMGKAERSNPESIIGSNIDKEIEEIVKKKNF